MSFLTSLILPIIEWVLTKLGAEVLIWWQQKEVASTAQADEATVVAAVTPEDKLNAATTIVNDTFSN